jgi:anhydro-N-acetylmuramic acid kinase
MGKVMRALGLMSGTSLDGIDVAFLETDGLDAVKRGPAMTFPYASEIRRLLINSLADARDLTDRTARPRSLADAENILTAQHAAAVSAFLDMHDIAQNSIDVIGFHGQTVLHKPDSRITIQIGCGDHLADLTGCRVVYDLRAADVAAGGQGAPLVPVYHRALTSALPDQPLAIVNIGGVANVTWIGADGRLIAFDTGPGNALIDDWMIKRAGQSFDEDGHASSRGRVHDDVVRFYLSHAFFGLPPPKSLDRNAFFWDLVEGLSIEDGAATLAAFTAGSIAKAREHMPEEPALWIVSGGGRRNKTLMSMLAGLVQNAVVPAEAIGLDGDSVEAEAWAYLAVRSLKGLPLTFPGTTGVAAPLTGGIVAEPQSARRV